MKRFNEIYEGGSTINEIFSAIGKTRYFSGSDQFSSNAQELCCGTIFNYIYYTNLKYPRIIGDN